MSSLRTHDDSWDIASSVGTTAVRVSDTYGDHKVLLDRLVGNADWAMYRAKRAGGNGCRHQSTDPIDRRRPELGGDASQSIA